MYAVACAHLADVVCRFLFVTDYGIYWIHRLEHHPALYKHIHKPHHKWLSKQATSCRGTLTNTYLVPTPFASYAFHPVDGFAQAIPYHAFVFIFPIHRVLYAGLFVLVTLWTIFVCHAPFSAPHAQV